MEERKPASQHPEVLVMVDIEDVNETRSSRLTTQRQRTSLNPPRIVVAEDDVEMADLLVRAFVKSGYAVKVCQTGWDLLKVLGVFPRSGNIQNIALVVSDIRLPGISGLDVLKTCGYTGTFPPMILITAFGDPWTHEEAERLGAVDTLDKPFDIDELVVRVRTLVPPMRT
jgi:DNA-binding response OmpR family regulator